MKILIHSSEGDGAGLAKLMMKEGAKVDLFIKDAHMRETMSGIVPHVESMEEGLRNNPDFILFDLSGDGAAADSLRKDGHRVIGASALADKLELDRSYGVNVAKQYGIRVPKTTEFNDIAAAKAFVKKEKKPYAIKIDNNQSESLSYVAKDADDALDYLAYGQESGAISAGDTFILQEKINGAEISTELWVSNGVPIWPANSTFESKKFLAGELGQRTGCETSFVFHYEDREAGLAARTVQKISPLLKHSKWTGPIDINCIISEADNEPYFLEWTPRLGYSAIYAFAAILGIPISEFFRRIAECSTGNIPFKAKWGSALKLSIPPYPVFIQDKKASREAYKQAENVRLNGKLGEDFVQLDVKQGQGGRLVCAGTSGKLGECLGRGKSLREAWLASQKVFKAVEVPNAQGRYTDGSEDCWKRALRLRKMGYKEVPDPSGESNLPGPKASITPLGVKAPA